MKWIKVTERLPEKYDDKEYLVFHQDRLCISEQNKDKDGWDCWSCIQKGISENPVTHWMPLPEPPKDNK